MIREIRGHISDASLCACISQRSQTQIPFDEVKGLERIGETRGSDAVAMLWNLEQFK
jgi:hypothetical protein